MRVGRGISLFFLLMVATSSSAREAPSVRFEQDPEAGRLRIMVDGSPAAEYVYRDAAIRRPFFADLRAPGGIPVSRRHPPGPGDPDDHATMHPGLWLAFGDLGGGDFWRNRGTVEHVAFLEAPRGEPGRGTFAVVQRYRSSDGTVVAREHFRFALEARAGRYLLTWESTFFPEGRDLVFGDQEEMGLGFRLATPLAAKQGDGGRLIDAEGRRGESEIRGKSAPWCAGLGTIDGQAVAVTIMVDPSNVRPCLWHARDYGLIVANPFGRSALTGAAPDPTRIKVGESLTLRFGVALDAPGAGRVLDPADAYRDFLSMRNPRGPAPPGPPSSPGRPNR